MKKSGGILTAILLAAIYCFAIGFSSISYASIEAHQFQNNDQDEHFSPMSKSFIGEIVQSENSIQVVNTFPKRIFKISFIGVPPSREATEQLFESEYAQYTDFSRNILTRFRKSDTIFPFHYFW